MRDRHWVAVAAGLKHVSASGLLPSAAALVGLIGLVAGCSRSDPDRQSSYLRPVASLDRRDRAAPMLDRYDHKTQSSSSERVYADGQRIPKGGGTYKIGSPYKIAGRWYIPTEDQRYDRRGLASWYGADFHGRKTANGEIYDMHALTAAHPTLPIPSYAYVTSLKTGRTVLVRINDRGPYAHERIMDLSRRTAEALGVTDAGVSEVRVRYAGRAPLNGDDTAERRFLAQQPWASMLVARAPTQPRGAEWRARMGLMRAD